jgi:hypothetical protein
MVSTNISMPHPVLGIPMDMSGEFNVDLKFGIDRNTREYVFREINALISNDYVKSLTEKRFVDLVLKISCIPTYKTWVFQNPQEIKLPETDIDLIVEIEAFLVVNQLINNYCNNSFNNVFGDRQFELGKGDIIGFTGNKKIPVEKENEKASIGSIFRFSLIDKNSEEQEIHFGFDEDQIVIYYPSPNDTFDPITLLFDKTQGLPYTALSLYIIPALTEAFKYLREENDINKRWSFVLESLLPKSMRMEDDFINAQRVIDIGIPINKAFEEILHTKNIQV